MPVQAITVARLRQILANPPADRILPNGRISLRNLKFGSETGVNKCDLHELDFDLSNCDFRGAMLTTDNLKQLLKMRANNRVPMHNNRIDIRGALITENRRMIKNSRSVDIDAQFSYEINRSFSFFRENRNLPPLPAPVAPIAAPVVQPPQAPAVAINPAAVANEDADLQARDVKRIRRGG